MPNDDDVFLQIKKWTIEDRVFKLKLPDKEGFSWAMELSYPFKHPAPVSIIVLNPADTDFVVLQISMKMSPQHFEGLNKKGPAAANLFYFQLQKMFLEKDVTFNIDSNNQMWIVSEQIHFDGLTKNELFRTIRRIHNAVLLGNMILDEVINATFIPGPSGKKGSGKKEAGGTGNIYQ